MRKQPVKLLLTVLIALFFVATVHAAPIALRHAHQNPDTGWSSTNCVEVWNKNVEKATGDKVKIQTFYGQTLAKGKDMYNSVKSGITDIGWCFHGYWPGMTPVADVVSLPALPFTTAEKGSEVLWKLYEQFPEVKNDFKDVQVLLLYTSAPYNLITTKKPVATMADLKGLKIRMTGGPPTDMLAALGGVPMLIAMPDVYLSMQKGVIDGMGAPDEAIQAFRLYEVVEHHLAAVFPAVYFSISMNKSKWNSLPKDVQDAIMSEGALKGSKFWGKTWFDALTPVMMENIQKEGRKINFTKLADEERAKWREIGGEPIWAKWVKEMEGKGVANAQKILDATLELSK
jgi:TRAP-type C4-dicarboxylate transport system substrate-binding protein